MLSTTSTAGGSAGLSTDSGADGGIGMAGVCSRHLPGAIFNYNPVQCAH